MRVYVFIDYWNLQLTLNQMVSQRHKAQGTRVKIDWQRVGTVFAQEAHKLVNGSPLSYEGTQIYTSFNPSSEEGKKFKNWATNWLDRQPGINVQIRERRPKALPKCPTCHKDITHCPHTGCEKPIVATVEKGIDTLLVTDLVRLANSNSYDVAVLASSDADMVPAVEFVQTMGKKIVQAGFPPIGVDLATQCWASFDVMKVATQIERP